MYSVYFAAPHDVTATFTYCIVSTAVVCSAHSSVCVDNAMAAFILFTAVALYVHTYLIFEARLLRHERLSSCVY